MSSPVPSHRRGCAPSHSSCFGCPGGEEDHASDGKEGYRRSCKGCIRPGKPASQKEPQSHSSGDGGGISAGSLLRHGRRTPYQRMDGWNDNNRPRKKGCGLSRGMHVIDLPPPRGCITATTMHSGTGTWSRMSGSGFVRFWTNKTLFFFDGPVPAV